MRKKVHVETSVIGAYFENRTDIVSVAQRHWTRRWWEEERGKYDTNPNKFDRIRILNTSLGVFVPALITPNQLTGGDDD